jgi:hypothetical protein
VTILFITEPVEISARKYLLRGSHTHRLAATHRV